MLKVEAILYGKNDAVVDRWETTCMWLATAFDWIQMIQTEIKNKYRGETAHFVDIHIYDAAQERVNTKEKRDGTV